VRVEKAALKEIAKAKGSELQKAFRLISVNALRLQQLQMIFLDLPIVPKALQGLFLGSRAAAAAAAAEDPPDVEWFDLELPESAGDGAPKKFVEYDGERLPGEFSIPIVPYPFVVLPGSQVRLNLFEPRYILKPFMPKSP